MCKAACALLYIHVDLLAAVDDRRYSCADVMTDVQQRAEQFAKGFATLPERACCVAHHHCMLNLL